MVHLLPVGAELLVAAPHQRLERERLDEALEVRLRGGAGDRRQAGGVGILVGEQAARELGDLGRQVVGGRLGGGGLEDLVRLRAALSVVGGGHFWQRVKQLRVAEAAAAAEVVVSGEW